MTSLNYGDYRELPSVNINEPHLSVIFVCDTSGSMSGPAIENVNRSLNRFASDVCKNPKAARRIDVAVLGFNSEPYVQQNWRPVTEMIPVAFEASGGTNISAALELSVKKQREKSAQHAANGTDEYIPHIVLFTDGKDGDVTEIAKVIRQRTAEDKMRLWVMGVKGYNKAIIAQLTDGVRVFELVDENGFDFSEFIDFLALSFKTVSVSVPGQRVAVKSDIGKAGSTCRVPNLDAWLN